jgi:hypothetical protein
MNVTCVLNSGTVAPINVTYVPNSACQCHLPKTKLIKFQVAAVKVDYAIVVSNNGSHKYLSRQAYLIKFLTYPNCKLQTAIISLNSVTQLVFVMVKCGVLFEVRTEFLNNI